MNIENKIRALSKAVKEENREGILFLLAPNMEPDREMEALPKDVTDRWNELEEKGIKILET